jgi:hypothetical protein
MVGLFHHNHIKHLEHIFLSVSLGIIIGSSLLLGYWLVYPDDVVVVTKPVTVNSEVYHPGERLTYTLSYCKTRKLVGNVVRSLINGTRLTFTTVQSDLPVGCHTVNVSDLVIPDYADSGTYHIEATIEYKINPIRTFEVYFKSQEFKINK